MVRTLSRLDSILVDDTKGRPLVKLGLLVTRKRLFDTTDCQLYDPPATGGTGTTDKGMERLEPSMVRMSSIS